MLREVMHIGITVRNLERSIKFYRDILGLNFKGQAVMEGKETDELFDMENCKVKIAYLNSSDSIISPLIELLEFINHKTTENKPQLNQISASEICFKVDNIEKVYEHLINNNVECLSSPQEFDLTDCGFGKSKALYFKDPDGIILELMETF